MVDGRFRILVLGGYGHFGARICRALIGEPGTTLIVAGRHRDRAATLVRELAGGGSAPEAAALDHADPAFAARLSALAPNLVIHTSGPFQGQDYRVASAAIDAGSHYADLADGRSFVTGIGTLDRRAAERGCVVLAGASTLPAVSAAVVDACAGDFLELTDIEISIAPGQATPRGLATLAAVLSYCGRPFDEWRDGRWTRVHGWQGLRRIRYRDLGTRWGARCDVPDLALLPERLPALRSVRFDAALELAIEPLMMAALAGLVRARIIRRPESFARIAQSFARRLDRFGTDVGGMRVRLAGVLPGGERGEIVWELTARSGHGPQIPCLPAVVVARKLARGVPLPAGARPCVGLMTLAEFDEAARPFAISWRLTRVAAGPPARKDGRGSGAPSASNDRAAANDRRVR